MKNQNGFAQVFLLSALPFILGSFVFLFFWLSFLRLETTLRHQSRQIQITAQDRSRKLLSELFRKNETARKLKLEYEWAQKAWLAAVATGNPVRIAAAQARVEKILFQRQALDLAQKALIQAADLDLRLSAERLYAALARDIQKYRALHHSFWLEVLPQRPGLTRLAVVPVSPDIAPEYRTQEEFSRKQALAQRWQYRIRVASPLDRFFAGEARFESESRITLAGENQQWRIENRMDKF